MRRLTTCLVILLAASAIVHADAPSALEAQGSGAGQVALHFYGSLLAIEFDAALNVVGTLLLHDESLPFEAFGTAIGTGEGDSGTLEATIWSTIVAEGTLESGEPISIRGGLSVESKDVEITAAAAGGGTGSFYLIVTLPTEEIHVTGTLSGDATGGFVPAPPDDPYAMVFAGDYTFFFDEAIVAAAESDEEDGPQWPDLPWDLDLWPEEMSSELVLLLEGNDAGEDEPAEESGELSDSL